MAVRAAIGAMRCLILSASAARMLAAQPAIEFSCPMDRDVRSKVPGQCPRCGMKLVAGIPEPREYRLDVRFSPSRIPALQPLTMEFRLGDPVTGAEVREFETI